MADRTYKKFLRKRTLSRDVSFAPMRVEDLKYVWASYKKKPYSDFFPALMEEGLEPDEFARAFEQCILEARLDAYILSATTEKGLMPVGYVLLWPRGRVLEIQSFQWFDWATPRNILEASLNFLNQFRSTVHEPTGKKYKLIGFANLEYKRFFDQLSKYKVLRLIGKSYKIYDDGGDAVVYETR